jgi:shikimate kinase
MDDLSMAEADLARILAALAARTVRVTIDALPAAAGSADWAEAEVLASDRQARHELGVRGVWIHDAKDYNSTHFLEALGADPDQQRTLIAAGAIWVGPRHLAPV